VYSYVPTVVFDGSGVNEMTGGSLTLASNALPNLQLIGGTLTPGPFFQGGSITNLNLGAVTLAGSNTVTGVLTLNGGTLAEGALTLQPYSTFNFSGTLSEPLTVPANAVMNLLWSYETTLNDSITNQGIINWDGGNIYLEDNASIYNLPGATFSIQGSGNMIAYATESSFVNGGTLDLANTSSTATLSLPFNNTGGVYAYGGTLDLAVGYYSGAAASLLGGTFQAAPGAVIQFGAGGYLSGTFTASPGGQIELTGGVFSNAPSVVFNGGGSTLLAGGAITLTSDVIPNLQYQSGTVTLSPQFQDGSIANLTLAGAGLAGTNIVTGTLNLDGGTVSGSLTIAEGGILNVTGPNKLFLDCALTNAGTFNWLGGDIELLSSNNIENLEGANFNIDCNQSLIPGNAQASPFFVNAGTITQNGQNATTFFVVPLANTGLVNVETGALYLEGGGSLAGQFATSAGAAFVLNGGLFTNGASLAQFTGAGVNELAGASLYLPADVPPGLQLGGGSIYLGPGFQGGTITNLTLGLVTLAGSNTVTGTLSLTEGTVSGPLTIGSNAVLNLNEAVFDGPVTNQGTINWTGGNIAFASSFYNLSNAVLSVQCDAEASGTFAPFCNYGLIEKTYTTGDTAFYDLSIVNTGTVDVESGQFYFGYGAGLAGGVWAIGVTSANSYGSFDFASSAVLTNALNINLRNGFQLSPGNAFALVSYAAETGQFQPALIQPPEGNNVSYNYGSTSLTLTVNSIVVPVVKIVSPTNYQTFTANATIPISVTNSDANTTVLQVQYYQGNTLLGTAGSNFTWSGVAPGFYTLTAKALDAAGSIGVSAPVNILVSSTNSVTYTWTGASCATWSMPGNWQPAGPPTAADNAIILGGPAVVLDTNAIVNNMVLSGGSLTGNDTLTIASGFNWTGGALSAPLTIASNATLYLDGAAPLNAYGATVVNLGVMDWTSGNILANGVTVISNAGTWLIQTTNNLSCTANFINTGSISNVGGAVSFVGGGVLLGSMTAASSAANDLAGGVFDYGVGATFAGPGYNSFTGDSLLLSNDVSTNLVLAGGTVTLGPAFQNAGAITNLTLNGSTLAGSNTLNGSLTLLSGNITGQMAVGPAGVLTLGGNPNYSYMNFYNLTLINSGQVLLSSGELDTEDTLITNNNIWVMQGGALYDNSSSLFVNNGSLVEQNPSANGSSYFSMATFLNNGIVDAASGELILSIYNGGTLSGSYNTAAGAAIGFDAGNLTLDAFPAITGQGTLELLGGSTLTILTNIPAGFALDGGTVVLGAAFQSNGVITNLTLDGATLTGNYTVSGAFNWLSGMIDGSLTVASNATLSVTGGGFNDLENGAITNFGSVLWSGATLYPSYNTLLVNYGLWLDQADDGIYAYDGASTFLNESNGVFEKNGTTGDTTLYNIAFTNFGTVDAETGRILFDGGGNIGGTYQATPQASVLFNGGVFTPVGTPAFTGGGTFDVSGGLLQLANDQVAGLSVTGGAISLGSAFQNNGAITNLTLSGATLYGPCVVTGTLNWLAGAIYGPLTIASNATLNFPSSAVSGYAGYPTLASGALTNFGVVNCSDYLELGSGAMIVNNGAWLAEADNEIFFEYYPLPAFINNGIFSNLAGADLNYIEVGFTNNGLVDIESGTLYFSAGGQIGGVYHTASAASVLFDGGYYVNVSPVSFTGAGAVSLQDSVLTLMSDQIAGLPLTNDTLELGPDFQNNGAITNLTLGGSGNVLQGAYTVTGTFNWLAGELNGSLTIATNGLLNIAGPDTKFLDYESTLNNSGLVAWSGGAINGYYYDVSYSFITNNGLWLAECDNYLEYLTFINTGAFRKSITSGQTHLYDVAFNNTGTLDAESGLISFDLANNYSQAASTLAFGAAAPNLAGQLEVAGNVSLSGALALHLLDGYTPRAGDAITLMTYGSATGSFSQFNLPPLGGGLNWETDIGATSVSARVVQALTNQSALALSGSVTDSNNHPIAGATVYATVASTAGSLIQNGSFESPAYAFYSTGSVSIPGWTVTGPSGSEVGILSQSSGFGSAEDGSQYLDPIGNSVGGAGLSQTFSTTPGAVYDLIFYHGAYSHYGINAALGVAIGTNYFTFGETSGGQHDLDWRQVLLPFVATSNLTTLSFTGLTGFDSRDNFVDNVQVIAPDSDRVLEAVTDTNGNCQVSVPNATLMVNVAGLEGMGYNAVASQAVTMSGGNQTVHFVTSQALTNYTISASVNPAAAGSVSGAASAPSGSIVILSATSSYGYAFANWTLGGIAVGTNASSLFIVVTNNAAYVANFIPTNLLHAVTVQTIPPGVTTVLGAGVYSNDQSVVINAPMTVSNAADYYAFQYFTLNGVFAGSNNVLGTAFSTTNLPNIQVMAVYAKHSINPPVVAITSPSNGAAFTTTNTFTLSVGASSLNGLASLVVYDNGATLLASAAATNITTLVSNLAAGSHRLTAVATDTNGTSATSAPVHITINVPGTILIDFEAMDASAGPVSGSLLATYLAGYGVTLANVSTNTTVAVQDDQNILGGSLTVASSGDNLLTQTNGTGAGGAVSYTLLFNPPYPSVSWTRAELLAGSGGVQSPAWQATAYDSNGVEIAAVGEQQTGSFTNIPAQRFTLGGAEIASITFAGNNSLGSFATLPLDDLLLSTSFPGASISISLGDTNSVLAAPGQIQLTAQASDTAGSIVEIDFYQGQVLLGSVLADAGGSLTRAVFNLTNVAPGSNSFTAVATDNHGDSRSSAALPVTVAAAAGVNVINFDSLGTSSGAVGGALLSNYLAGFGITASNVTLGTRLEAVNGDNLSGNAIAVPSSPPNLFTQVGLNQPVTFTLNLAAPVGTFGFTRVALAAGQAGISHPAWTARAFNAAGTQLASVSEPLIFSFANVPARVFQLTGRGITRVRFDSDSRQTAAFSAVLLDDLVLDTNAAANALSVSLAYSGTPTAPATLQLTATVTDTLGALSNVAFYAGPNLIGAASGSSPSIAWTNVLAGTYILTAQAVDNLGYTRISSPVTLKVASGQGMSALINFDSLNASRGPVTGTALADYFSGFGLALTNVTAGTQVAVENQGLLAGGGFVAASSPSNLLTQIGGNGPAGFAVRVTHASNWLASFTFTRPELLANPFVTQPAWQATAYDALGVPLAQAGEGFLSSYTNVPAQTFTLAGAGAGIASVQFSSQGSSLTTFEAAPLDDFILTKSLSNLPPAVLLTNPLAGQVFTTPAVIELAAQAAAPKATVTNVSFYANGALIASASSSPFLAYWTNLAVGAYTLTAVAADSSGLSRTSPQVNVTVSPPATVFGILTQPAGETVAAGQGALFSVQTTGTNAVAYQWYFDGSTALPGKTQYALSVANVSDANNGTYTVQVTSAGQTLISQDAVLTVLDPPAIITPPPSQITVGFGSNATLSVVASNALSYQWSHNGASISGATASSYSIAAAQPLNSGNYAVTVANSVGSAESQVTALTVTFPGAQTNSADAFSNRVSFDPLVGPIFGNNTGATFEPGEPEADGEPGPNTIWYTWRASFDGVISLTTQGSSFDTLLAVYTGTNVAALTPVAADDDSGGYFTSLVTFNCSAGADYQIQVAGFQGASGSVVLGLPSGTAYRVLNAGSGDTIPLITQQPANQLIAPGAFATLSVMATNGEPLTYQWFFQGAPVSGGNGRYLVIPNFQSGSAGNYYVLVANSVGSAQSASASLQLSSQPPTNGAPTLAEDKFGDSADLSQGGNTQTDVRPKDSGGDTAGFSVAQTFSTVGATREAGEPDTCGQTGGASEWYVYTTTAAGVLHVDTSGSAFNTILGVYTNNGGAVAFSNLVSVACGYTTNYQSQGQPSLNVPGVAARTTYYITVDGYNAATGVARLNIGLGNAPRIVTQPQSRPATLGGSASFSVAATGTTNLSYQWRFDAVNLAGATSSALTLTNIQTNSLGSYSVIVSNAVDTVTSAVAVLTLQSAPFIVNQPAGSLTVNQGATADFSVTAAGVKTLSYQWEFDGSPISRATASKLAVTSAKFANAGTYTVVVKNSLGSVTSAPAILIVNGKSTYPLSLQTTAGGKITGQKNQAPLEIGNTYKVTAAPLSSKFLFSSWTGGANTNSFTLMGTNATLSFVMASNLVLQANFITNPFPAVAGTYYGLFAPVSGVTAQSCGFITLTLAGSLGGYSAKISMPAGSYSFTGAFDLAGTNQAIFTGPGKELVTVALQVGLNLNPPDNQISGTVTSSQWQSDLAAYRKVFNGTTDKANAYAARYTLVIPPVFGAPETSPGGYGAAGLTNNPAGMAALVGYLGDGAAFNQTVPISADGVMAVYASLYKGQGILLGWLTNAPPQPIAGTLNWVKLSGASKTFYAGGFTNQTDVISSFYKPPSTSKDVLNMTNATLTIAGGDLADPLVYTNVTVAGGKLTFSGPGNPTNQISAAFTAGTGAMTLTFRPTGAKAGVTAQGAVLPMPSPGAAGWFLGANQSGYFLLEQ
jgi:hypothetical protein